MIPTLMKLDWIKKERNFEDIEQSIELFKGIIKVHGDDNIIGLKKTGEFVAQFSADGIPEWDIKLLNFPIIRSLQDKYFGKSCP